MTPYSSCIPCMFTNLLHFVSVSVYLGNTYHLQAAVIMTKLNVIKLDEIEEFYNNIIFMYFNFVWINGNFLKC